MKRPSDETPRERRLQRIVGMGVVVLFLLLSFLAVGVVILYRAQANHHTASANLQTEIITKDKVTIALLKEHSVTFAQQKVQAAQSAQYDTDVEILAKELVGQEAAVCAATHAACPALPPLP